MIYRYLSALILASLASNGLQAQTLRPAPRLVVNIAIDQLRTDYLEHFAPLFCQTGFKKLLEQGRLYENASYSFSPVDQASATAAIATGSTPYYNNIVGNTWLDRNTLRPVFCVDDSKYLTSPSKLATSTVSDELKVSTAGSAIVIGVAKDREAAVMSAGHAANGAFWIDSRTGKWTTSTYYPDAAASWLHSYTSVNSLQTKGKPISNLQIGETALACANANAMGRDDVTDYLAISLSATGEITTKWQIDMEAAYRDLDQAISKIVETLEKSIGSDRLLVVLTSTGCTDELSADYSKYRIPTGTFYINRTASLLNVYLSAVYGGSRYVEACYKNQIYLNRKLIEQQRLSYSDVVARSREFIVQSEGVRDVLESPYNPAVSGDLIVEVAPGWKIVNEDTHEQSTSTLSFVPFPIVVYGAGVQAERVVTPVTAEQIAPTIAKSIQIRAPNGCKAAPLP